MRGEPMSQSKPPGGGNKGGRKNPRLHQKVKTARGRTNSSSKWLERQLNDPKVQQAKAMGYRSRAAFKLSELDDKYHFLKPEMRILDLGAAPGGWSQVAQQRCKRGHIIALDLLEFDPVEGVTCLQMDFMAEDAEVQLHELLEGQKVDLVLSDMAPNASGNPSLDHLRIMGLVEAVAEFAYTVLKPGGGMICKVWQGGAEAQLLQQLQKQFTKVRHAKPASSRKDSAETFLMAHGFRGHRLEETGL